MKRSNSEMVEIRTTITIMVAAEPEVSPKKVSEKLGLTYARAYQLVRKEKAQVATKKKYASICDYSI